MQHACHDDACHDASASAETQGHLGVEGQARQSLLNPPVGLDVRRLSSFLLSVTRVRLPALEVGAGHRLMTITPYLVLTHSFGITPTPLITSASSDGTA